MSKLSKTYKRALITGGHSGLGKAFAYMLYNEGLDVWTTTRNPNKIPSESPFNVLRLDINNPASLQTLIQKINTGALSFDILINNAGAGAFYPLESFPSEAIEDQIQLLLTGPILLTQAAYQQMQKKGHGTIVNVSSLAAEYPIPYMALYNATKAALSNFTQSLILENTNPKIHFIDLQPGDFQTNFNDTASRVQNFPNPNSKNAWEILEKHRHSAPKPGLAAKQLCSILKKRKSGQFAVGDFFQAKLGPIFVKVAPKFLLNWFIKRYYKIRS